MSSIFTIINGDCIEIRLTNLLPEYLEESPFQMRTKTDIAGYHIHLVKFDTIVSDEAANGWNNIAGARQYQTLIERIFANTELNTVFFTIICLLTPISNTVYLVH